MHRKKGRREKTGGEENGWMDRRFGCLRTRGLESTESVKIDEGCTVP